LQWESVKKVMNIGVPAALTQVVFPLGLAALTFIVSLGFKEAGAVAFSLGFRLEFFAFLPAIGFGFGAMAMIGQNIGAGNFARAKEAFNKGLQYGFAGAAAIGVVAALFAGLIIGIFTQDPVVTDYARSYMWVVALVGYGFLAAMMVEASAFQAIGKSWPGFWIFVLRFGVVSIPLGYVLTQVFHLPIVALWAAILAGNIIAATAGYFWIRRTLNTLELKEIPAHA
jgi:Na+-driven multidrug efflux pump